MPATISDRPAPGDHAPYFARYIGLVPAGDLVAIIADQLTSLPALLARVREEHAGHRYAPDKWSVREQVGHLTDTERVFAFRATHFSRHDASPLPGYDQGEWAPHGEYDRRTLDDLVAEWCDTRRATLALVRAMPVHGLSQRGVASGAGLTALAALCILPGHVRYHMERLTADYAAAFR